MKAALLIELPQANKKVSTGALEALDDPSGSNEIRKNV